MADLTQLHSDAAAQLRQLIDDEWAARLKDDPLFATDVGDHRYDHQLPAVSEADFARRLAEARVFLKRLTAIERRALPAAEQLNYDIFQRVKTDEIAESEFRTYTRPIDTMGGFHANFAELPSLIRLTTLSDYENLLARLQGFQAYAGQYIELMRGAVRAGYLPARASLKGVAESIQPHLVGEAEQSVWFEPFKKLPDTLGTQDHHRLAEAARVAITQSVVPGYRALGQFVTAEYLPAARASIAASDLPDGRAFYEHRVRYFTSLNLTSQQVHDTGLSEVNRIRAEMEAARRKAGFSGDFKALLHFLRTDPRFYAATPDALMKEVALILKRMDGELPRLFKTLPRMPCGLKPVPDYIAPSTTTAYYMQPAGDGTRAGFYYVNTYDLKSRPFYELEALSLHEAVPGHHLQIALQQELPDLPAFRRFGGFTAFIEGWGLYAERLGLEAGFYTDPYNDFGRLTYEMWRACRLVVDTGMHYLGWTRQRAIDFMAENTALTLLNVENEIDRYISMPGQALAYKIGELKIRELRERARQVLGARFDVREFHDVVLRHGALPLDVLETTVENWLALPA